VANGQRIGGFPTRIRLLVPASRETPDIFSLLLSLSSTLIFTGSPWPIILALTDSQPAGEEEGQIGKEAFNESRPMCNEHGTIYAISSDFDDRMTTQSMGLIVLLSEHF